MDPSSHSPSSRIYVGSVFDVSSEPTSDSAGTRGILKGGPAAGNPFIGIQFTCCQTYGRIYRNADATAYCGHCPKCAKRIEILIGPGGGSARFFSAG